MNLAVADDTHSTTQHVSRSRNNQAILGAVRPDRQTPLMPHRPRPPLGAPLLVPDQTAPELDVTRWFNTDHPLTIEGCRGRVVVLHAFQMLCPGCVLHGLPQAQKIHALFDNRDVEVIGVHTVFEHHSSMPADALKDFLYEFRFTFPIAVDRAEPNRPMPATMSAYALRGTPSLVMIDRRGIVRHHSLGQEDDMAVGAAIAHLVAER